MTDPAPRSIAFVHGGLGFGGTERVVVEQVRACEGFGCPVDVWTLDAKAPADLVPQLRAANRHLRDVAVVESARSLTGRLWRRAYDVVVTSTAPRAYRALLRLRWVPFAHRPAVVETVHERSAWSLSDPEGRRRRIVDLWLLTYDVRAELHAALAIPEERTAVARPLFATNLLEPTPADREAAARLRASRGIPREAVVVGYVGRWSANKGLPELLAMVADLVGAGADVHLALCGRYWPPDAAFETVLETACREAIARVPPLAGRLHRLGAVPSSAAVLPAFDLVALPSRREVLLPLMLVEAMSVGVPVVTTDVGGIGTCLTDGVDAAVVAKQPDDESPLSSEVRAALRARVEALVRDPVERARLGAAGRARVRALVTGNDFAGDTRRAIARALELRAGG